MVTILDSFTVSLKRSFVSPPEAAGGITIAQSNVPAVIGALIAVVIVVLLVVIGVAVVAWQFG